MGGLKYWRISIIPLVPGNIRLDFRMTEPILTFKSLAVNGEQDNSFRVTDN